MLVEFEFDFYYGNSWAELNIDSATDLSIQSTEISEHVKIVNYIFTTNNNSVTLVKTNKKDADTIIEDGVIVRDQYIKIKRIRIDDILLDLNLIGPYIKFIPEYSVGYLDYCKENNIVPPPELQDTAFYFNGTINFNFELPFWDWYAGLRRQQILKYADGKDLSTYFGIGSTEDQLLLDKLKALTEKHV